MAEATRVTGSGAGTGGDRRVLDAAYRFLPTANKPAHRELRDAARQLVTAYTTEHAEDLYRVWETGRAGCLRPRSQVDPP